ncbi:hypothetical protein L6452_24118 [Arctium lappa]|uniref:Uncharacterized protein n=1 Tax=Arctium lappa TaxID=4217 RepID=A0ACB9A882_ARCLA|nr:hypothetical protein L6452_24118 [Arctium lappa]
MRFDSPYLRVFPPLPSRRRIRIFSIPATVSPSTFLQSSIDSHTTTTSEAAASTTMATDRFIYLLAFTLLFTLSVSSDPPQISPSPVPQLGSDDSPSIPSPSPTTTTGSPPAPPPSADLPPAPSSDTSSPPSLSPAPELAVASDVSSANVKTEESKEASSGGMSTGKKAGIAIGVIGAACVVGFGGMLYKKRQYNIRRAEFSSAARREFL